MIFLALQMLGLNILRKFQITAPKFITRYLVNESNFKGRFTPFLMGASTFFLPCGFTITAQGLALISGNPLQGSLIMLFFALGTLPSLLLIGFSSIKFFEKPHLSLRFLKVAGFIVLFFAVLECCSESNSKQVISKVTCSLCEDIFNYQKELSALVSHIKKMRGVTKICPAILLRNQ